MVVNPSVEEEELSVSVFIDVVTRAALSLDPVDQNHPDGVRHESRLRGKASALGHSHHRYQKHFRSLVEGLDSLLQKLLNCQATN